MHRQRHSVPAVIDYEPDPALCENGQPARRRLVKQLEWREGDGLYATGVEWTEKAQRPSRP
nr:phage protease [Morganella morganii]